MDTNLATIQIVSDLQPIPNADAIEVASMKGLGWKCVVKKGEFKIGDKGVYICIDTVVPEIPEFEFLRKAKFRVKTIRLRKQLSQGLLIPVNILDGFTQTVSDGIVGSLKEVVEYQEGQDVTKLIGIKKYEKEVPLNLRGQVRGAFPSCVHKTDEIMLQSILPILDEIKGMEVYITVKCDGTSSTFANIDGDIHVCSRNLSLKETDDNVYWQMFRKYMLSEVLKDKSFAIQAEICSPGVQKNPLGLKQAEIFVFDVYDIKAGKYLNYNNMVEFCESYNLPMVPLERVCIFDFTLEQLLEMAKGKYSSGKNREGIVVRPIVGCYSRIIDEKYGRGGRMSFKVLNNDFLEKDEE